MTEKIKSVAIIGAGTMGSGIALALFRDGYEVNLCDVNAEILKAGYDKVAAKTRKPEDLERIKTFSDIKEAVTDVDLVIEAVFEDFELKKKIFELLDESCKKDAILATNTSSISISKIADTTKRPEKVIGLHFFNPAYLMKLVEIIPGEKTDPQVLEDTKEFASSLKRKIAIVAKDAPGFIFNRILIPLVNEAFYFLEKNPEKTAEIDKTTRDHGIMPMGPYELSDLIGLDVILSVSNVIFNGLGQKPEYAPPSKLKEYVDNGRFGIKNMHGIYKYEKNELGNPVIADKKELDKGFSFDANRLIAIAVNESCKVLEDKVAACPEDIDAAIKAGGGWSKGIFEYANEFGIEKIKELLNNLYEQSGKNPRYLICEKLNKL
ncbi:MAG: 3-hydroxyacyl-CoA dehydrogenase NAD-binding domain-containing protein [Pseudomonadota bacterium]